MSTELLTRFSSEQAQEFSLRVSMGLPYESLAPVAVAQTEVDVLGRRLTDDAAGLADWRVELGHAWDDTPRPFRHLLPVLDVVMGLEHSRSRARNFRVRFHQEDLTTEEMAQERAKVGPPHLDYRRSSAVYTPLPMIYLVTDQHPNLWLAAQVTEGSGLPPRREATDKERHAEFCEHHFAMRAIKMQATQGEPGVIMAGNGFHGLPDSLVPGTRTTLAIAPVMIGPVAPELEAYVRGERSAQQARAAAVARLAIAS